MELQKEYDKLKKAYDDLLKGVVSGPGAGSAGNQKGTFSKDYLPLDSPEFTLEKHRGRVTSVVIHPIVPLVVTSSEDASIRVWNIESGDDEKVLRGHTGCIN